MKKLSLFVLSILLISLSSRLSAQNTGTLKGTVTDSKTGEPLIGATVVLEGTSTGASTNLEGNYTIKDIEVGSYNIQCSFIGYVTQTKYNVVIRSTGNIDINFELQEDVEQMGEVVVTANPFRQSEITPLSRQKLSQEEIVSYPGGNNDIAKVVQTLPGVSGSVGGFRNDVIIRGGAPNENVYFLDGVEIPNINHFSTQGSAGGPVGLLNVSFFEGVTLSASSFGAQYGNVLSGVLQFDQRTGDDQNFAGNFRLSSSEAALTVEGPLFKGSKESANTTYIASVRRSYLQLLFGVIGLPFLPDYWDYQYKVNHKIDKYNDIYVTGVGSIDDLAINELDEFDAEQQAVQDQIPVIRQRSNTLGIGWKSRFKDNSGYMLTVLSNNYLNNQFQRFEDNVNETGLIFKNDSEEMETRLRYNLTKFNGDWTTTYGLDLINADYQNTTEDLVNNVTFGTDLNLFRYGLFAQTSTRLLNNRMGLTVGLRADGNSFTNSGNEIYKTISPRASITYDLTADKKLTANASAGRYYKILPYTTFGYKNNAGEYINKNTEYIRSEHLVAGLEYLLTKSSRLTLEGFFKYYSDYPVSTIDSVSLANKGGGFEVLGSEPVVSNGLGRTYGAELLYQQKFTGNFYSIAALTLYKSEFSAGDDTNYAPAVWDNGVLVSLLGGYKFGNNWEVSGRYRYLGGSPYPPVDQQATLNNYPAIIRDYSRLGDVRLGGFSQLDIRIDKKWSFKNFSLDLFLDIQNVLAQQQPSEPQFGLERNDQGEVVSPENLVRVDTNADGSVLPSIGIVINF
jgi:hypothetical protein